MDYDAQLSRVLENTSLSEAIKELATPGVLNLATLQWRTTLENCQLYQDFQTDAGSKYSTLKVSKDNFFDAQNLKDPIQVLLVGKVQTKPYLNKDPRFSVLLQDSPPLNMLMNALNSDVDKEDVDITGVVRTDFENCSLECRHCRNACRAMKMKDFKSEPCILNMCSYNGVAVVHCFTSSIRQILEGPCIAILKLSINTRYFFTKKDNTKSMVRMRGLGLNIIAFPKSNLISKEAYLVDLSTPLNFYEDTQKEKSGTSKVEDFDPREEEAVEILMPRL